MLVDLTQYLWILWLALVVLFIVIEVLTLEFTFLMIAAGSLIGGLGSNLLGWPWYVQIALAAAIAGLLIFTIRPVLLMNLEKGADPAKSNVEALYELGGFVTASFTKGIGEVKLDNGETWTARIGDGAAPSTMPVGKRISVLAIEGAIAVVVLEKTHPSTTKPRATTQPPRKEEK
ncbi:NfeD family protein [Salinibacterium sp. UTAS2018]|uniref:NfeD family protein n=1 Tax=unclassified Salinibacterium TaxID=2632331 RepID=UPI00100945E8|nr:MULTISPECIES: NfeD family protein [unclassified Salinibacterium]MBH0009414.1 NfeD family protein [Salinibacterium sp. SWN1162]QAV69376.1 NfeD family protein [Salinibacterium sp. UTAS2018]